MWAGHETNFCLARTAAKSSCFSLYSRPIPALWMIREWCSPNTKKRQTLPSSRGHSKCGSSTWLPPRYQKQHQLPLRRPHLTPQSAQAPPWSQPPGHRSYNSSPRQHWWVFSNIKMGGGVKGEKHKPLQVVVWFLVCCSHPILRPHGFCHYVIMLCACAQCHPLLGRNSVC